MENGDVAARYELTVTTETKTGKWSYRAVWIVCALGGLVGLWWIVSFAFLSDRFLPFPVPSSRVRAVMVLLGAYCVVVSLIVPRSLVRGDWHLDDDGIIFVSLRGVRRSVKWRDVEAVRWHPKRILFRASGATLTFVLEYDTAERRQDARCFLRKRLTAFDLRDPEPKPWSLRRICMCLGLAMPIVLLGLAAAYVHCMYLAPRSDARQGLLYVYIPLIAWAIFMGAREARRSWRFPQLTGQHTTDRLPSRDRQ
jgi:hypothetical protein